MQAYFAEVGRYWVEEFRVDGWRLDVANEISKELLAGLSPGGEGR